MNGAPRQLADAPLKVRIVDWKLQALRYSGVMDAGFNPLGRRARSSLLWLWMWCAAAFHARGQEPSPASFAPSQRHIFIIDQALPMARHAAPTREAIEQILKEGLNGRIKTGDLLEVWTFGPEIQFRPVNPQVWMPELEQAIAHRLTSFLRNLRTERSSRLDRVFPALERARAEMSAISVYLFTDGQSKVQGSPWDMALNDILASQSGTSRRVRNPLMLSMESRDHSWVSWSLKVVGEPGEIASFQAPVALAAPVPRAPPVSAPEVPASIPNVAPAPVASRNSPAPAQNTNKVPPTTTLATPPPIEPPPRKESVPPVVRVQVQPPPASPASPPPTTAAENKPPSAPSITAIVQAPVAPPPSREKLDSVPKDSPPPVLPAKSEGAQPTPAGNHAPYRRIVHSILVHRAQAL
ncbi:MAG: hypothetical protein FJ404_13915 [Verrucomicrobia bacterium]|nr:hypothetical protein [Verrucomicrobiota bacterium]